MSKMESRLIPNMWQMVQSPTLTLLTKCSALLCWYVRSFGVFNNFHKALTSETKWLDEELDRQESKESKYDLFANNMAGFVGFNDVNSCTFLVLLRHRIDTVSFIVPTFRLNSAHNRIAVTKKPSPQHKFQMLISYFHSWCCSKN